MIIQTEFSDSLPHRDKKNVKFEWIDIARTLTMILVIIGHCNYYRMNTPYGGIDFEGAVTEKSLAYWTIGNIISFVYSFHMPLFMAISGLCYALSTKKRNFCQLVKEKAQRLLKPFILVTFVLVIPCKYLGGYWQGSDDIFQDIVFGQIFLLGNSYLWFVVSLFYIFLSFQLIKKLLRIYPIVTLVFLFLFSGFGFYMESSLYEFMGITGLCKHLLFFSLGYTFVYKLEFIIQSKLIQLVSWIALLIIWKISDYLSYHEYSIYNTDFKYLINTLIFIWGIINMVQSCSCLAVETTLTQKSWFQNLKRNSYSLYLYSDPFNYVLIPLLCGVLGDNLYESNYGSIIAFMSRLILTMAFAYLAIAVVKIGKNVSHISLDNLYP